MCCCSVLNQNHLALEAAKYFERILAFIVVTYTKTTMKEMLQLLTSKVSSVFTWLEHIYWKMIADIPFEGRFTCLKQIYYRIVCVYITPKYQITWSMEMFKYAVYSSLFCVNVIKSSNCDIWYKMYVVVNIVKCYTFYQIV